jgi:amino acid adenylation domain-containing protein
MSSSTLLARLQNLSPERAAELLQRVRSSQKTRGTSIARAAADEKGAPLSFAQQRLWMLEQLDPGSPAYIIPAAYRLTGRLDVGALEAALNVLTARHETLRTVIARDADGSPFQRVAERASVRLAREDLRERQGGEALLAERVRAEVSEACDLERGPLWRARLIQVEDSVHVLVLSMHHIVFDGWSLNVFTRELFEAYRSVTQGVAPSLEDLPLRYRDYAAWQRGQVDSPAWKAQLEYWRAQLGGSLPPLDLPTKGPRPVQQTFAGAFHTRILPRELFGRLQLLTRSQEATMFQTFLSALYVLLARYSGQTDLIVGCPIAGRHVDSNLESLIGVFVNTLALRVPLDQEKSFVELLSAVKATSLAAFENQDVPFDSIVEEIRPPRDPSRSPVFQVLYTYQNAIADVALPAVRVSYETVDGGTAKFDLSLDVFEGPDGPTCVFEYNTSLFESEAVAEMASHFETLLSDVVARPDSPISELRLLSPREVESTKLRNDAAELDMGPFIGVARRIEQQAALRPHAPAVSHAGKTLDYQALNTRANRLARHLRKNGVETGSLVALCLERSIEMAVAVLAVWKAGAAYVPIDPSHPEDRVDYMLEDAGASSLVTTVAWADRVGRYDDCVVYMDADLLIGEHDDSNLDIEVRPDALAYMIYTSGTTGRPKGTLISHDSLENAYLGWDHAYRLRDECRAVLQAASFPFDVCTGDIVRALCSGNKLVICSSELLLDGARLYELMRSEAIDCVEFVPAVFRVLASYLEESNSTLSWVRVLCVASDAWYVHEYQRFQRLCGATTRLINSYGVTEATIDSTYFEGDVSGCNQNQVVSIGTAFPNVRVYVLDESRRPVPTGVAGELWIGGRGVSLGYHQQPELTAERFASDPFSAHPGARMYRTGDLARFRSDHKLELLGRLDHQVKLRGFRIELDEVASVLSAQPGVRESVVILREDRPGDKRLIGYVVAQDAGLDTAATREAMKLALPEYMIPSEIVLLTQMPLTANGKIDRKQLPEPDASRVFDEAYVAPRTLTEEMLCEIWKQAFGRRRIGVEHDFFRLGGHSLLAIQIVGQVRQAFGVDLPMRALFQAPTVSALARMIADKKDQQGAQPSVVGAHATVTSDKTNECVPFPLTDVQQAYWLGRDSAFDMGNVATHSYDELDFENADIERIEWAWNRLIQRHGMLRAVVLPDGTQRVLQNVPEYHVEVLDLRGQPASLVEQEVQSIRQRMSHQMLEVECWPVFELRITRLSDTKARIHLSTDALTFDAWSYVVLLSELAQLHQHPERELPALELTFRDYVLADRALEQSDQFKKAWNFWQERLPTLPARPDLPMAKSPGLLEAPKFTRHHDRIDAAQWKRLKQKATKAGLTPSGVLLAAYAEVLTRWSKSPRFCLNLTFLNRMQIHPQVNEVVGEFTSLTLLEVDNGTPAPFVERARKTQDRLWSDLEHNQVSGVKILRELNRIHGDVTQAKMPVVFTSALNLPIPDRERVEFPITPVYSITQTSQVWLDCGVWEDDGVLYCNWDVVDELFPAGLLADMFAAYFRLIRKLADEDTVWQAEVPAILPEAAPAADEQIEPLTFPESLLLHDLVLEQCKNAPEAKAIIAPHLTLTFGRLAELSERLAWRLRELGAEPNQLVAVVMEKGWEQIVAVLAILRAGAAYLPIDANLPPERISYLLSQADVQIAVVQQPLCDAINVKSKVAEVRVGEEPHHPVEGALESWQTQADLAYVIFTSGSTGTPKGVMIDHRGAVNTILDVNQRFGVTSDDRVLALSSLSFDLSVYDVFGVLGAGGAIVLPEAGGSRDPNHWLELMHEHGVTLWNSVPALLGICVDYANAVNSPFPSCLRLALLSGDWIPVTLPDEIRALCPSCEVISLGGATEASIWSILYPIGEVPASAPSIPYGRAMRNQTVEVLDEHFERCPTWVSGSLYIGGIGVALGYWRDAERTNRSFVKHPRTGETLYRTGDSGRYLPDGNIEFLGRDDLQVKVQGYRIELGEIEHALSQHPDLIDAAVVASGEKHGPKRLIAYLVCKRRPPHKDELRAHLRQRLPEYMIPSAFHYLDSMPLSMNGKVDRASLPKGAEPTARKAEQRSAHTPLEQSLIDIWSRVLGVEDVSVHDNFFELGGNSMSAISVVAGVRERIHRTLPLRNFFRNPTIEQMARVLEESSLVSPAPSAAS